MFKNKLETENVSWKALWTIYKWGQDSNGEIAQFLQNGGDVKQVMGMFDVAPKIETIENNIALEEGLGEIIDIICGLGSPTTFSSANAYLGVGDSSTAASASQTGLQASTNKLYKALDSEPTRNGQTVTFQATFGTSEANFQWYEFTVANGNSDSAKNLNRKVEDKNTKSPGETWTLSLSITFS